MEYEQMARRYGEIYRRNSERFLASFRPKVVNNKRVAIKGELRCKNAAKEEPDHVEEFLKEVYLGNFLDEMYNLSLSDVVSMKRNCESIADKFGDRTLSQREYKTLSSIAREFPNTGDYEVLKKLSSF